MARIDGVIILDSVGKPLITSHFAHHPAAYPAIFTDAFNHEFSRARKDGRDLEPVLWAHSAGGGVALCHLERDGLRYLVPISAEVNPLFGFAWLESFLDTLKEYLVDVTEVTVKDNFDVVYMLIEEMLDEGHPMTMETAMLKDIVLPPSLMRKLLNVAGVSGLQAQTGSAPFTAPIPWRRLGVRHAQNEIFFDVGETLDAVVDRKGHVLSAQVWGRIGCNSRLSGNPDLLLNISNTKAMAECSFHPCVRYSRWERDHVLSFIPPDGKFKLLEYEATSVPKLPFVLKAGLQVDETGGRFSLTLSSRVPRLDDVVISIFLGSTTTGISATPAGDRRPPGQEGDGHVGGGTAEFDPHTQVMKWTISSLLQHERSPSLTGSFVSTSCATPDPAFAVAFNITNYTYSGLRVDQLKVSGDVGYKPFKGPRSTKHLTADLDDDLDLDDDPFPLPRVGAHPHTHPCSHPRSSTCSRRNTPPQHNTLVFHRKGSITSTNSPSVNLPSSPPEFSSEPIFFRTRSQRGKSRANVHRSSENFINSLQPVSLWNREQELGDSSPEPSPTSPPPGESLASWSRRPSFATCSSRASSTNLLTPPLGQSPRRYSVTVPGESPYLDAPFISASPVLSSRGQFHSEPCFDRIVERRCELVQQRQASQSPTRNLEMANAPLKRKIVILGSPSVGKTSITQQYVTPPTYNDQYYPTIESTSNKIVVHKGVQYDCEIVDTAGQDEFSLFPPKYAVGVHGYVLVYSITSKQSFDMIVSLHEKILDQGGLDKVPCVIVGQKTDLEKERRVTRAEGEALAKKLGAAFLESSAKDNKNVDRAFEALLGEMQREYNPAPAPAKKGWWPWS
ncbi:hypothetical protein CcaverHIS641_0105000 [Cutaneotrichosporon cavernicola]|nr:hypothetical protein CcaverHIS641_0105000 [Cutaneotrichosporon cavernicola]